jgi:hypothetical protein
LSRISCAFTSSSRASSLIRIFLIDETIAPTDLPTNTEQPGQNYTAGDSVSSPSAV